MSKIKIKYFKTLSRNDTGETNSHQCGISIPKIIANTEIFPKMGIYTLNPKVPVIFYDENGNEWEFNYTYYNDVFFGKPANKAHNEYRLTVGILKFMRANLIKSGDKVWFGLDEDGNRRIGFCRSVITTDQKTETEKIPEQVSNESTKDIVYSSLDIDILNPDQVAEPTVIKISKNWERIDY